MAQVINDATKQLADDFIGAAQILEQLLRRLKADAKAIRQNGLLQLQEIDAIQNQRMHKVNDIQSAAAHAAAQLAG